MRARHGFNAASRILRWFLVLSLSVLLAPLSRAAADDWITPATLKYSYCGPGVCPLVGQSRCTQTIGWASDIVTRRVFSSADVRFGPFTAEHNILPSALGPGRPTTYMVRVLARSPSGLDPSRRYIEIGRNSVTLNGVDDQQEFFVDATLKSIFSTVKLEASISSGCSNSPTVRQFPIFCDSDALPPPHTNPDEACMQAAVNFTGVLVPQVIPVGIIYEPPGNCSWANLEQFHTVGSRVGITLAESQSSRTLESPGIMEATFWDAQSSDVTFRREDARSRFITTRVTELRRIGTVLSPNGCPVGQPSPSREHSGPGEGDLFLLLVNQPLIFWDTGGMTNFLLVPPNLVELPPNTPEPGFVEVFAWQLKSATERERVPKLPHLTDEQARAILDLNPFTSWSAEQRQGLGMGPFLAPPRPRFVRRRSNESYPPMSDNSFKLRRAELVTDELQACSGWEEVTQPDGFPGTYEKLLFEAIKFAATNAATIEAGAAASGGDFASGVASAIKDVGLKDLVGESRTTVTTTFTSCKHYGSEDESGFAQEVEIRDTGRSQNVDLEYDYLFGALAVIPHPGGTGTLGGDLALASLPSYTWTIRTTGGRIRQAMPSQIKRALRNLGAMSLAPVRDKDYSAVRGVKERHLKGLEVSGWEVSGVPRTGAAGPAQSLYAALNSKGDQVAFLWLNIDVTGPQVSERR